MSDAVASADVVLAAQKIAAGEVIGLPTETVYGLAADGQNPQAVARIFAETPPHQPPFDHTYCRMAPMFIIGWTKHA